MSLRPCQIFYQTKGGCFSSFINSALREAVSEQRCRTPGRGWEPGRAACGAAEPCLPSRAPGAPSPARAAGRLAQGEEAPLPGSCGTFQGHKPLSRRPQPRPARSSADTELARASLHFSPQIPNKTERKISEEAPALKRLCKHLRLEISILPLPVRCVD